MRCIDIYDCKPTPETLSERDKLKICLDAPNCWIVCYESYEHSLCKGVHKKIINRLSAALPYEHFL